MSISTTNQVILIAVITITATVSAATRLERGIRRLSELNLSLAGLLLLFVSLTGPAIFLISSFIGNVCRYASNLVDLTFRTDAFIGLDWQKSWTMFYWAWWISWSPFVGMFIARISRGRTLREFIGGVLRVPATLTFFWLTVFGGTALHIELFQGVALAEATQADLSTAIFVMLEELPPASLSSALAVVVVTIFFVTSANSGALVIDTISSGDHPERSSYQRIGWAFAVGADGPWQDRLSGVLEAVGERRPVESSVERAEASVAAFIENTVVPAFRELGEQLETRGREVRVEHDHR